jgi:hypothetical protein
MLDNAQELKTHVALLEKDVTQMTMFVEKLDSAIEKLADVSASIKELLAVHDHKLNQQSQVNSEIYDMIKQLKIENHAEHSQTKHELQNLANRINSLEKWKYSVVGGAFVFGSVVSYLLK